MSDTETSYGTTIERIQTWIFLIATVLFLLLSALFFALIPFNIGFLQLSHKILAAFLSFGAGIICNKLNPAVHGRTMKYALDRLGTIESVDTFIALHQNVGTAGFFNRIGLVGIPLAVAILAVALCGLALVAERMTYQDTAKALLEMAKITTGAFIGALTRSALTNRGDGKTRKPELSDEDRSNEE